jgi:hypothetical protein
VQHVALHEGFIPGLAEMRNICGGSSSDIQIPGEWKEQAENIKQLLMVKIQTTVMDIISFSAPQTISVGVLVLFFMLYKKMRFG